MPSTVDLRLLVMSSWESEWNSTSSTRVLLPEPDTPVTRSTGQTVTVTPLRLCFFAPTTVTKPLGFRARGGSETICSPRRYIPVSESEFAHHLLGRTLGNDSAAMRTGARQQVEMSSAASMVSASCSTTMTVFKNHGGEAGYRGRTSIVPLMKQI